MFFPSKFYRARSEFNTYEKHVNAPNFRANIQKKDFKTAKISVSGLGFYDLFINGKKITKGLLAPYISNPDHYVYFDSYDVTDLLKFEVNCIAITLGNGMQNCPGGAVWDFDIAAFRNPPCYAIGIAYEYDNGEIENIDIGNKFKWSDSPIFFDDLRSGIFYNANDEMEGWMNADFDDSGWNEVNLASMPRGEFRLCDADPIVVTQEIPAIEIKECKLSSDSYVRDKMKLDTQYKLSKLGKNGILYDFGINTAGICRLKISAKKGQEIYIVFCEHMTTKGEVSYVNTGAFSPPGYAQVLYYICKGDGEETFEPPFTYYGYRYALIFGLEKEQILSDTLVMLRANSDMKERGNFECSDEIMNTLGKMSRISDLANFYYFPTDCPQREKNGWTGDAAVSAERMLLTLTPEKSYLEWLHNICKAQNDEGALPGVVPTGTWGFDWGNGPAWDNVLTELCWQIWRMRGDLNPAKVCAESILRYLSYISQRRREDGLIAIGLGDWLQPDKHPDHSDAPLFVTDSVITMYIAKKSADLFGALNLTMHKQFAVNLYDSLKNSIRNNLINFNTMTVLSRCQTSQAMCIYYGVFDESEKKQACDVLIDLIHEKNDHFACGMLGLRVIFHVLSDCGESELAYKMITRKDHPSYTMMIKQGLTSLAESFLPESRFDSPDSLNHHFMGDIISWFIQRIVGIQVNPRLKGANDFNINPSFISQLTFAKAYYEAPCGEIFVEWERTEQGVKLNLEAPTEATGFIILPDRWHFINPKDSRNFFNGASACELKSGKYLCVYE